MRATGERLDTLLRARRAPRTDPSEPVIVADRTREALGALQSRFANLGDPQTRRTVVSVSLPAAAAAPPKAPQRESQAATAPTPKPHVTPRPTATTILLCLIAFAATMPLERDSQLPASPVAAPPDVAVLPRLLGRPSVRHCFRGDTPAAPAVQAQAGDIAAARSLFRRKAIADTAEEPASEWLRALPPWPCAVGRLSAGRSPGRLPPA
jgi:hypothetical protein